MIYFVILLSVLFGVYYYDYRKNTTGKLVYAILICVVLICVAGFRYRLGGDTVQYIKFYNNLHDITALSATDFARSRFAPGFVILASVCKLFTPEMTLLQFIVAGVVNTVVFNFFWKYARHFFFAILLYYVFLYTSFSMEVMREALTVSIFLIAWPWFRDGKWIWWYAASLLAFFFHVSSAFMFILPLICLPGIKKLFILGRRTWFIWAVIVLMAVSIYNVFFRYIELLSITDSMMERTQLYEKSILGGSVFNINGTIAYLVEYLIYPIGALYFLKRKRREEGENPNKFNKRDAFVLISSYICILALFINILSRFNNYFLPFALLVESEWALSAFIMGKKRVKLKLVTWIFIFLPLLAINIKDHYFNDVTKSGSIQFYSLYYPYDSVFEKNIDQDREKAIKNLRKRF